MCPFYALSSILFYILCVSRDTVGDVPREETELIESYSEENNKAIFDYLTKRGFHPKLQRLDNEASRELKDFMEENEVDFQLTPTHSHRRNAAERAIRTFKNHFRRLGEFLQALRVFP